MRRILVLSVTLLTIFLAGVAVAQLSVGSKAKVSIDTCDPILAETFLADPISAVGHGRMQNAEGDEIEVTPEFIFEAQRYYVKSLFQQADETQRAKFRKKQKHLSKGKECDQEDQVYVNFALIAWLIDTVDPENASTLASINTLLLDTFVTAKTILPGQSPGRSKFIPPKRLLEILQQEGTPSLSRTLSSGTAYIEECKSAGVPMPPKWPGLAGSPEWVSRGIVNLPKRPPPPPEPEGEPTFAVEGLEAQVFTSESSSPRGLCFALPRYNKDVENSPIELLGIICQGNDKSKACFWDNQEEVEVAPGMKVRTNVAIPRNEMRELTKLAGGAQLNGGSGGVCSDCHAGENAFVIHPGTALTEVGAAKLKPNNWHEPLVHPSWPHNPGPTNLLDGIVLGQGERACTSCHNQSIAGFPEVSRNLMSYCTTVLKKAVKRTMPPANINLMPPDNPGDPNELYSTHRTVLLAECDKVPRWIGSNNDPRPGNSPANSFSPCFPAGSPCPVKKTVEFKLSEDEEVLIRYDLGQSHGCCADHSVGILRILLDGTEVLNDQVPYVNYGVQPISEFLEDFDYFFPPEVVKGRRAPVSHLDSTRVGPILTSYKLVNRFSLGNLPAGPHNLELWVGDAGWNSILEIYHRF